VSKGWIPAEHGSDHRALQPRVARGLTWTIADIWGRQALNLIVFVILARLLTPADFGLVALAAVFVAFAQLMVDQGLGDALIQRRDVTRLHIDTAFWVAVATGGLLTLIGLLLSAPIAGFLHEPELEPILRVLSFTLLLAAPSSIQIALLRRELAFRSLAIRAILATLGGGAAGIALAVMGFGAWALVGQQVTAAGLSVVTLWRVSPWRPSWQISMPHFRQLFSFGANVVGSDILSFVSRNTDNLLIGVVLGTTPLGFYAVGYRILDVSQTVLVNIARKITFPAFSRLQYDRDRLRSAYFRVTRAGSVVILPGYVGLALIAPELTVLLFGHRWTQSGPVAAVLFLIGPVLSVQAFSDTLLNAAGHPEVVFRFRTITAVTNVLGFLIAVPFGIVAVAVAFVLRGYLLLPLSLHWMRRYAQIPVREFLAQLRGPAVATLLMAVSVLSVKFLLTGSAPSVVLLGAEVGAGVVTFIAVLWLVERGLLREVIEVARQAMPRAELAQQLRGRSPLAEIDHGTPGIGVDDA
jgi:O-antigen/teichoic acid export membrane protein